MTQEKALELFEYKEGIIYWKLNTGRVDKIGKQAGTKKLNGYMQVQIKGKIYLQHRIIFLMHYGFMPTMVDHRDRNRSNNKIENLREATPRQNQANRKIGKNNTTGFLGVSYCKVNKKFVAGMKHNGKHVNFGLFKTAEQASEVYKKESFKRFKEFANV